MRLSFRVQFVIYTSLKVERMVFRTETNKFDHSNTERFKLEREVETTALLYSFAVDYIPRRHSIFSASAVALIMSLPE